MLPVTTLLLVLGSSLRITRLIVDDKIAAPLRGRATGWLDDLISCPWCFGFWVVLADLASAELWSHQAWWQFAATAFTLAWLVGILTAWLDSPPPPREIHLHHEGETPSHLDQH